MHGHLNVDESNWSWTNVRGHPYKLLLLEKHGNTTFLIMYIYIVAYINTYVCSYDVHSGGWKLLTTAQIKSSWLAILVTLKMVESGQKCENFWYVPLHILHVDSYRGNPSSLNKFFLGKMWLSGFFQEAGEYFSLGFGLPPWEHWFCICINSVL